ncbi:unnamed protein product [Nippostrongylus brasiliensis]|uniref:Dimer_Tnp_hAT domain-containing protein n=1 Tax=Nippostrongylus brasiliensis TaxID=27835 RepID=A0A0N4YFQ4_NIPBR|nr:unnamed protein product [Nippostrongylus brasiliensis]
MRKEVEAIDGKPKELVLKSDHRIAITAVTWTSVNANCSLLAITAHTAQSGFEERSNIVLDCASLEHGSHTAAVIEEKIRRSLSRLEVDMPKVSLFEADGAAVMKSTAMNLNLKYVQCCAHVILLAAKAAIESESVKQAVQKVRKIVAKLNLSHSSKGALPSMLFLNNFSLSEECVYRNCNCAKRDARQFGDTLLLKLRHYFDDWFEDETLQLASLMDPRFAFMETVLPFETWMKTIEKLKRLNELSLSTAVEELEVRSSQECLSFCKEKPVWAVPLRVKKLSIEGQETSVANLTTKEDDFEIEMKQYAILLKRARPTFDSKPLEWWRTHHDEFPQIAAILPQYLVCPASSVDCKRLFSLAGIIYGNKRSNLKGDNARLLLMIKTLGNVEVGR